MFSSRYERLEKRIAELEQWKARHESDVVQERNFVVYDQAALRSYQSAGIWNYQHVPQMQIAVKDAINKILAHLGLELTYVAGTPASVAMQKTNQPRR